MPSFKTKVTGGLRAADRAEVRRALEIFIDPGQTFAIQGLPSAQWKICRGSELDKAVEAAWDVSDGTGTYFVLNPCRHDIEKMPYVGDILSRRWFLIDGDRVQTQANKDTNATEDEKNAIVEAVMAAAEYLTSQGWPDPVMVDSGNGVHLYYRVDLPNDDLTKQILRNALAAIKKRFDTTAVEIDPKVIDARRITKLPGTWARKGPHSDDRPHRLARLIFFPPDIEIVSADLLIALGGQKQEAKPETNGHTKSPFAAHASNGTLSSYVQSAINQECARIELIGPGGRNDALNRAAFALGTMALWPEMLVQSARQSLLVAGQRAGLGDLEIRKTIESGWTAGASKPRERPVDKMKASQSRSQSRPDGSRLIILASEVTPRKVEWLWPDRIPIGKLTTFAGWGGLGKSFVTMDLAIRVSQGLEMPGMNGECFEPGNVLILNTEDDPDDTSVPRLMEACWGLDLEQPDFTRIAFAKSEVLGQFTLGDLDMLDVMIKQLGGARLLVIDPATAHIGKADDHKNAELRSLLMPLSLWAMQQRIAVILVTHVNKPQAGKVEAMARVVGSVAWVNAVRAAVMFAKDPKDKSRRLFIPFKSNNAPERKGLAYRVLSTASLARIEWLGEVETSADEAMNHFEKAERKSVVENVTEWMAERFREKSVWESQRELWPLADKANITWNAFKTWGNGYVTKTKKDGRWIWTASPGWPPEKQPESTESTESKDANSDANGCCLLSGQLSGVSSSQTPERTPGTFVLSELSELSGQSTGSESSSESSEFEWDADLSTKEKRWERRRFKIGTWLRNLLWGSSAPEVYVIKRGKDSGFKEEEVKEVAVLIGVDMSGENWVYRGF